MWAIDLGLSNFILVITDRISKMLSLLLYRDLFKTDVLF